MTDRQDENAEIARRFLAGFSMSELAEDYPDRDVEQAFREHLRRQEHQCEGDQAAMAGLSVLLKALKRRPRRRHRTVFFAGWQAEQDRWMHDELDPAVDQALEIIGEECRDQD